MNRVPRNSFVLEEPTPPHPVIPLQFTVFSEFQIHRYINPALIKAGPFNYSIIQPTNIY